MIQFWQAIHTYFSANAATAAFRALLTGGLHHIEAKQGTAFPYGTYTVTSTPSHFASGGKHVEDCLVQFNLFSNAMSSVECLNIFSALVECFDLVNISVTDYVVLSCVRGLENTLKVDGVWQINVQYRIELKLS